MNIENVKPERVFHFFSELSKIPRGSGNEAGAAAFVENFAKNLGLFTVRDEMNNVFVRKPASKGCDGAKGVLLQGHMDMVCEKNEATVHDFMKDPIKLILEGDRLRADGTTLGADDGVAVAMMMAVLEDDSLVHGPLECLFTVEEETGLGGMKHFDKSLIQSDLMINLDSEESDTAVVGCASGVRTDFLFENMPKEKCQNKITLTVGGLMGGHSGADIDKNRKNANKVTFELLSHAECPKIISVTGGNKDNAIPRECTVEFSADSPEDAIESVTEAAEELKSTLSDDDGGFFCKTSLERGDFHCFSEKYSRNVITLATAIPSGIILMNEKTGCVDTSCNLGIVRTSGGNISFTVSSRSGSDERLDEVITSFESTAEFAKVSKISHRDRYPGWEAAEVSPLCDSYRESYRSVTGREANTVSIHAGLECGLVKGAVPRLDIISIGPDAVNIHTPDEWLSVSSTEKVFNILKDLLERLTK